MCKHPVRIPAAVLQDLEIIRRSGVTNMLDRPRVIEIAEMMGEDETAAWLRANRASYSTGLFQGFAVDETPKEDGAC
jgi:hypothetical protein